MIRVRCALCGGPMPGRPQRPGRPSDRVCYRRPCRDQRPRLRHRSRAPLGVDLSIRWRTVEQVADAHGVSVATVAAWRRVRGLPVERARSAERRIDARAREIAASLPPVGPRLRDALAARRVA